MSSPILAVFLVYILWLFHQDAKRRGRMSPALWAVVAWVTLVGSRPVSTWFAFGDSGGGAAESYDEGNPFERVVYFILIFQGLYVLMRRNVRLGEVLAANRWLVVFFVYWGVSVLWADAPFVGFKRWVKDLGNIVMALVILTDGKPLEAMRAVFVRAAFVLLPISVMFIRFIPDLGRTYHVWSGEMMYTGVTTHKNSLGVLVLISLMFLLWDFTTQSTKDGQKRSLLSRAGDVSLILMGLWLILKAGSATATGCFVTGASLLFVLRWKALRDHIVGVEIFAIIAAFFVWLLDITHLVMEFVIVDILGRDLTLTTRTEVWPMLIAKVDNPLIGAGFNSFWTGERLAEVYGQLGIIQAHNGYIETYLNGGVLGLVALGLLVLAAIRGANKLLVDGAPHANLAFAMVLITVVYNCTEASYDKTSPLWFAFLLVITRYRDLRAPATSGVPAAGHGGAAAAPRRAPVHLPW